MFWHTGKPFSMITLSFGGGKGKGGETGTFSWFLLPYLLYNGRA